ncbi:MAG TPA: hypothetical protein VG713_21530, partial [Pirellulales bacterium]|nr:hypothetical protein [Pirellulales bacterium]
MIRSCFSIVQRARCAAIAVAIVLAARRAAADDTLVIERPMLAGISGFRERWDRPIVLSERGATENADRGGSGKGVRAVWSFAKIGAGRTGAIVFDALHRSLLIRFP